MSTLQKDKSLTKSSKSNTGKASAQGLSTLIQYVKGVGPKIGSALNRRGIMTVRELLYFFPRDYEDRSRFYQVAELEEGSQATLLVTLRNLQRIPLRRQRRSILQAHCTDQNDHSIFLKWFHAPRGIESNLKPNTSLVVTGTVKKFMSRAEIIHPEISFQKDPSQLNTTNYGRVVPVYTEIEGISTRVLRNIHWNTLEKFRSFLKEDLPETLLQKNQLPPLSKAIEEIHFPKTKDFQKLSQFRTPSQIRLIYEEFFKFEFMILKKRHLNRTCFQSVPIDSQKAKNLLQEQQKLVPFELTKDQKTCLKEIIEDLSENKPMNRLIQGDVGSGKTVVALLSASCVLNEGSQAALMAPTEILAEQHFFNAHKLFQSQLNVALLTRKTPKSERAKILSRLAAGEPLLLIGTHAIIEDPVVFKDLRYVMIDEQHRFGVDQRKKLCDKGRKAIGKQKIEPHTLILTATPIPRTLALTAYGDLNASTIKSLPAGRSPVKTHVVTEEKKIQSYEKIRQELSKGKQAYFIFPLVKESEAEGFSSLKSAIQEAERLEHHIFPEFKVGLLHGQMKSDEKSLIMQKFKSNQIQVLVSTTIVEVGVDVPNATIMVIEHADRFGLSQLHQLRGRVGRGKDQSYCFLFTSIKKSEISALRLDVMEETQDGFKIADADLKIRGPGEFLGTRQSGDLPFQLASLVRDQDILIQARQDAIEMIQKDPDLEAPAHIPFRNYFEKEGKIQFERFSTS